jgi:hypothetical protein
LRIHVSDKPSVALACDNVTTGRIGLVTTQREATAAMANIDGLNANDKGIRFEYKGYHQARYQDTHEFYKVVLPAGVTVDDAMDVVLGCGYKTQGDAAWFEPYARICTNTTIHMNGTNEPNYELIVTFPYLD